MSVFKNSGIHVQDYVYDFAVNGGTVSTIDLSITDGYALLPAGATVIGVVARVLTACTSGGSATVEWGNTSDTDGYSGVAIAVASLTANAVFNGAEDATNPSALLFNNTNDEEKPYAVTATANTQNFVVKINTAALTAGKIAFSVMYLMPRTQ